jgi:hypothetical protein
VVRPGGSGRFSLLGAPGRLHRRGPARARPSPPRENGPEPPARRCSSTSVMLVRCTVRRWRSSSSPTSPPSPSLLARRPARDPHHLGRRRGRAAVAGRARHLPWNLHFRPARCSPRCGAPSTPASLVTAEQLAFAEKVKRWSLATSLGVHIISAAVALAIALFTGNQLGYPFAGFYLLSSLVRPATASMQQVRRRLEHIAEDTRFPRDDVMKLRSQVEAHEQAVKELREALATLRSEHDAAVARADASAASSTTSSPPSPASSRRASTASPTTASSSPASRPSSAWSAARPPAPARPPDAPRTPREARATWRPRGNYEPCSICPHFKV